MPFAGAPTIGVELFRIVGVELFRIVFRFSRVARRFSEQKRSSVKSEKPVYFRFSEIDAKNLDPSFRSYSKMVLRGYSGCVFEANGRRSVYFYEKPVYFRFSEIDAKNLDPSFRSYSKMVLRGYSGCVFEANGRRSVYFYLVQATR